MSGYKKENGQIFTPTYLVKSMLDYVEYSPSGSNILDKHIIDNSCGNGAFLCEIIDRYIQCCIKNGYDKNKIIDGLERYIHGIEKDPLAYNDCIRNLDDILHKYGILDICHWDIKNADTLLVSEYNGKMDFVVGNPPYVRVHNLNKTYSIAKRYNFATDGMTDLYLVFYEIGFNMLAQGGRLCYITSSSWFNSTAGRKMRAFLQKKKKAVEVVDLGHFQAFDNAVTYTAILSYDNATEGGAIHYYSFDPNTRDRVFEEELTYDDININGAFYFAKKEALSNLRKIMETHTDKVSVKNGFATLQDKVFISDNFDFNAHVIPVIKGSTGKWSKAIFPYDMQGKPLSKEQLFSDQSLSAYFNKSKATLLKGKTEQEIPGWYLFGRTQAIKDVQKNKISINSVNRDEKTIKINEVPAGSGVYSGLYILTSEPYQKIKSIIINPNFIAYIKLLRKYKSGGYYTYNTKDLSQYLNYMIGA